MASRRDLGSHVLGANHPEDVRKQLEAAKAKHRLLKRLPKLEDDKKILSSDPDLIEHTH